MVGERLLSFDEFCPFFELIEWKIEFISAFSFRLLSFEHVSSSEGHKMTLWMFQPTCSSLWTKSEDISCIRMGNPHQSNSRWICK